MIPFALNIVTLIASGLCLAALTVFHRRMQRLYRELLNRDDDRLAELREEMEGVAGRLAELESVHREVPAAVSLRSGMNLNKRTQALRQHRLGRPSLEIARDLDMPRAEVDLLMKVHRIVSQQVSV